MECQQSGCTNDAVYLVRGLPSMAMIDMSVCPQHVITAITDAPPERPDAPPAKRWTVDTLG